MVIESNLTSYGCKNHVCLFLETVFSGGLQVQLSCSSEHFGCILRANNFTEENSID
jgi:hypothetical protein